MVAQCASTIKRLSLTVAQIIPNLHDLPADLLPDLPLGPSCAMWQLEIGVLTLFAQSNGAFVIRNC
eukprot:217057-Amphidinium_carterae.1